MRKKQPYLLAMVLGTALAAMPSGVSASADMSPKALSTIERYCVACWRNAHLPPDRWDDCTQEVLRRLLERVPTESWHRLLAIDTEERREFVRAIDTVKKRHQRDRLRGIPLAENLADDRWGQGEQRDELDAVRQAAGSLLTPRQQQILQKSLEGYSIAEIASDMSLPPERISDEKYKAVQRLRRHFQRHAECV